MKRFVIKSRRVVVSLSLLALAIVGALVWRGARIKPVVVAVAKAALRLHFVEGHAYRYSFELRSSQRVVPSADPGLSPIVVDLDLAADLVVRCHGARAGQMTLGLGLERIARASLKSGDAELVGAGTLDGKEVLIDVDDRGHVARVVVPRAYDETSKSVLQVVAAMMQVSLAEEPVGAGSTWSLEEPTTFGRATSRYEMSAEGMLVRRRVTYTRLLALAGGVDPSFAKVESDDRIAVSDAGVLTTLGIDENVELGAKGPMLRAVLRGHATLTADEAFVPAAIDLDSNDLEARRPGDVTSTEESERRMLEQLAAGMTLARVESTLFAYRAGAKLPLGFVTSAVALLHLHPEYAQALVEIFERPSASQEMRALICDLLASTGHARAQAALRDALGSAVARLDPGSYGRLLQRAGLVATPTAETGAFVFGEYLNASHPDVRAASTYALGATLGGLARTGHLPAARAYNERLRQDLTKARAEGDRVALLAGMGNAGLVENIALVQSFTRDASSRVRKQAAQALRKTDTRETRRTLVDMLSDGEPSVALAALDTLGQQSFGADELKAMAEALPRCGGELQQAIVTLVAAHPTTGDAGRDLLRAILARTQDPYTQARVRMVLGDTSR